MNYPASRILESARYYCFSFLGSEEGKLHVDAFTHWAGWADEVKMIELREPSIVNASYLAKLWEDFGMPFHVVNTSEDYVNWFVHGGHAVITDDMAARFLPGHLLPGPSVRVAAHSFVSRESLPEDLFRRAPTRKMRMSVMKRDAYKCRICGRRPDNYVDIELHVHHIRPHGLNGVTHPGNLITLCDTCHAGLEPHFNPDLFDLLDSPELDIKTRERNKYFKGVQCYRKLITQKIG